MKNRASSHLLLILIILGLEIMGYLAVHRGGLLRGYETSVIGAVRDLMMFVPLIMVALWLSRTKRFSGNWVLYTTAVLLFAFGMLIQYRLYSDPEYNARNKAAAREEKMEALRMRYIMENYDPVKKQMMGLPPTPAQPIDISQLPKKESNYSLWNAMTSSYTWIPILSILAFAIAYSFCVRDGFLLLLQRNSFLIVLLTLLPLAAAVVTSSAGKALGNMTPWEPSKIPFLVGFAGILTARYKDLAETYWGIPRARDIVPLLVMAMMPFVPFFALKDFGQMLIFSGAYTTLYLVAVRRWPQLLLFVGSVVLVIGILVVGALPRDVQEQVPLLPTIARPISAALPARIQQRFHLWLDGFDPPSPEVSWWKPEYDEALSKNPDLKDLASQSPALQRTVNVDVWFDKFAFQPAQATWGISSGRTSGRGLGLGFPEVIPIADSDYIYAAIAEETGLGGGAIIILAVIIFVVAGVRTSLESRDMFTKLCAAGLTAFIGFQALVNIGGILRALPMTGITLPFVSHGGFSLITSFAMLGMLMAFSHRNARDRVIAEMPETKSSSPIKLEAVE
ncbi:MAG TPA: FtsW/RodA/SpoVE family cell cycle protein [Pyrinomonadaceae bacterium]|jgi:cell division protein FtsW (lipid II flippase)|nr:FtsW/RodA/SpoVE family cell cycle protein [Pyrinomonadaceae bacterium]